MSKNKRIPLLTKIRQLIRFQCKISHCPKLFASLAIFLHNMQFPPTPQKTNIKYLALPLSRFLNCYTSYGWHHLYVTPLQVKKERPQPSQKKRNVLLLTFLSMKTNFGLREAYRVFSLLFLRLLLLQDLLRILRGEFCLVCDRL